MTGSDFDFENMKRKQNDVFGEDEQWAVEGLQREGAGPGDEAGAKKEQTRRQSLQVEGRGLPEQSFKNRRVGAGRIGEGCLWALPALSCLPPFPYVPLSLDTRSNT